MEVKIPPKTRVIIIEGVAGSGKDTLQNLLKSQLKGKSVYPYSEGEVLFSWKHARIKGIASLRLKFMDMFVDYIEQTLKEDKNSIFVLNRFHLSTYMAHVSKGKKLLKLYNRVVKKLKQLPVHIFLLTLKSKDIEHRSAHSERPETWVKYQKAMMKKEGFKTRTERYLNEQKLMLEAAKKDKIPYSNIKIKFTTNPTGL